MNYIAKLEKEQDIARGLYLLIGWKISMAEAMAELGFAGNFDKQITERAARNPKAAIADLLAALFGDDQEPTPGDGVSDDDLLAVAKIKEVAEALHKAQKGFDRLKGGRK